MQKRKIYIVGGSNEYANWMKGQLVDSIEEADLVVFTGGEDVHPSLYKEPMGKHTFCNLDRDIKEKKQWQKAIELNKHIIGICRGSQFSCVMNGGRLVQDQLNPSYIHNINTSDGKVIPISSTHHQAQYPYDLPKENYKVLGWTNGISPKHLNGLNKEICEKEFDEVEICYYPKTKCLGIQGHPEMIYRDRDSYKDTFEYLNGLLDDFMNNKL